MSGIYNVCCFADLNVASVVTRSLLLCWRQAAEGPGMWECPAGDLPALYHFTLCLRLASFAELFCEAHIFNAASGLAWSCARSDFNLQLVHSMSIAKAGF